MTYVLEPSLKLIKTKGTKINVLHITIELIKANLPETSKQILE